MKIKHKLPRIAGEFIILGGSPSLHDELLKCPNNAVKIGVNHHAIKFYDVDYVDGSAPVKAENKTDEYGNRCKILAYRLAGDSELISNSWW